MKKSGSSAPGKRAARKGKYLPDSEIDFSDIPESTDEELSRAVADRERRFAGRPPSGKPWRKLISIRIDPDLLTDIQIAAGAAAKPYQTWMHEALARAVGVELRKGKRRR